ncbi:MAG: prepilin peptidase [Rhodospirillales bacterium]|nr:prepilin peptidase [Rhodospirillales bacterium]MCB9964765.1 prepilin peptidase [Rhodospirillales bacterium]MCB9973765.1 prepilin peptidase [Rhodospirillales bacterium]MCB9980655.1 prepilin peptidase [Rhodospirillales bacterium]
MLFPQLLTVVILCAAMVLLAVLTIIDFRVRLLPNKYVFPFAGLGVMFHLVQDWSLLSPEEMIGGGMLGYGLLWSIRALGSWYYKQEAMGLGDVKLMGAAGLWLGVENLMLALSVGAFLSILHGLIYALLYKKSLHKLEIPAGPGLIGGIVLMMGWVLWTHQNTIFT